MVKKSWIVLICLVGVFSLSSCAAKKPSRGEQMVKVGESATDFSEKWQSGEKLIAKGEKLKKKGRGQVKDGKEEIEDGEDNIEEGEQMMREGRKTMEESEQAFRQRFPDKPFQ